VNGRTPPVVARGLYHIYREGEAETVALRGAELELKEGTWTSLMGPSGSGKSTLVQVIAGLLEPSGGSVLIDGEEITAGAHASAPAEHRRHPPARQPAPAARRRRERGAASAPEPPAAR
jgi:ABC-type lipoprotein export system ATPase subunit